MNKVRKKNSEDEIFLFFCIKIITLINFSIIFSYYICDNIDAYKKSKIY